MAVEHGNPVKTVYFLRGNRMALAIATNNAALNAAASASSVNRDLETSMARLSSGKRINSASDDAAGVSIASRLTAEIKGTDQAIRNALDGQALIDTAEASHKEVETMMQRMREIAIQAANDTYSTSDRSNLGSEMKAIYSEIDRVAQVTSWAGQSLFSGGTGPAYPVGARGNSKEFTFQVGSATSSSNRITVNIGEIDASALNLDDGADPPGAYIYDILDVVYSGAAPSTLAGSAMFAVGVIDDGLEWLNAKRSSLGAVSNRLNHTVNNLTNISTNLSAAKGGIEDADFALETTQLAKNQILQQASTAMLAQANASKQNVLGLLGS